MNLELNASVIDLLRDNISKPETATEPFTEHTSKAIHAPLDNGYLFSY